MDLVLLSHTRHKCPVNSRMRVCIPRGPQNAGAIQGAETHDRRPRSCFFFFFSEQFFFLTLLRQQVSGKKKQKHLRRL